MKHNRKPRSDIIRKLQGRRFAERCLWTGERPIAFYALAQNNTTQKKKMDVHRSHWARFEPTIPVFEHLGMVVSSTAQNCKCYGPVPYVGQRSTAMFVVIMASRQLCCSKIPAAVCHTAQQSLPNRGFQVDYQRFLIWVSMEEIGDPWTEGSIFRRTGGKNVTASEPNCLNFKYLTFLPCFIFLP